MDKVQEFRQKLEELKQPENPYQIQEGGLPDAEEDQA